MPNNYLTYLGRSYLAIENGEDWYDNSNLLNYYSFGGMLPFGASAVASTTGSGFRSGAGLL